MALHLSNPFSASRQRNWNNKTFLSDFITWFFVEIPRGDFHSSCFQMHWYHLCSVYLFLLDVQFRSLWLRVSHYPPSPREGQRSALKVEEWWVREVMKGLKPTLAAVFPKSKNKGGGKPITGKLIKIWAQHFVCFGRNCIAEDGNTETLKHVFMRNLN